MPGPVSCPCLNKARTGPVGANRLFHDELFGDLQVDLGSDTSDLLDVGNGLKGVIFAVLDNCHGL